MFRRRIKHVTAFAAVIAVLAIAAPAYLTPAYAASGTISVTPGTQGIAAGGTATVTLTQSAASGTTGAEATISFDPSLVQLVDAQPGPAYVSASILFGRVPGSDTGQAGQPLSAAEAVAEANQTGVLVNATTFLAPGTGSVPAGDNPFLVLTFKAVAAAGTSPISLTKLEMLDDQYNDLEVTGIDGEVVIGGASAPPPAAATAAPGSAVAAAAGATAPTAHTPTTTAVSGVLGASSAPTLTKAAFAITPATLKVAKDATFTFDVTQEVDGAAANAQAKLTFKQDLLEVVKLEPGSGWKADAKALESAMTAANSKGELDVTLTADKDKGPATSGQSKVLTVTMKGRASKEGTSSIKLAGTDITGSGGSSVPVTLTDGNVTVGSGGDGSSMLLIIIGGVAAIVIIGGGGAAYAVRRSRTA